ncbi:MAG: SCO family protein [Pseudomonadota bacterium]|nr:SCO family protein [Pseudomonadota bacterium]
MNGVRRQLVFTGFAWACAATTAAAEGSAQLPADSVYRIPPLTLRDQSGAVFDFASLRGTPRLVGMFYTSCTMACPIEIEALKYIGVQVSTAGAKPLPVLLVSFDPANDDVAALKKDAKTHQVSAPAFRLTRPERGDVGMLAGVLGIAYRRLNDGGFSHNVVVALLDAQGRIVATTDASGKADPAFVKATVALSAK